MNIKVPNLVITAEMLVEAGADDNEVKKFLADFPEGFSFTREFFQGTSLDKLRGGLYPKAFKRAVLNASSHDEPIPELFAYLFGQQVTNTQDEPWDRYRAAEAELARIRDETIIENLIRSFIDS